MRPFKLGLSRPKPKKKEAGKMEENTDSKMDISDADEINVSRETIKDISDSYLKKAVKVEPKTLLEDKEVNEEIESPSILDLVDKISNDKETVPRAAEVYDMQNSYIPEAGPSKVCINNILSQPNDSFLENSDSSLEENNTGIMSFYTSKVFNLSLEGDENISENKLVASHEVKVKVENYDQNELLDDVEKTPHKKEQIYEITNRSLKIITPKIKPPTASYIAANLEQYKIQKIVYPEPFYSDYKDVGTKIEVGQLVLKLHSRLARDQKPFEKATETSLEEWRHLLFMQTNEMYEESAKSDSLRTLLAGNKSCVIEPVKRPPSSKEVKQWIKEKSKNNIIESKIDDMSYNIEELDNSQALGLNEDVIDDSISLESNDKVVVKYNLIYNLPLVLYD